LRGSFNLVVTLVVVTAFAAPMGLAPEERSSLPPLSTPSLTPAEVPIQHIVVLLQENHAFDNLFGTYCAITGKYCPSSASGIPPGTCVPYDPNNLSLGCVAPYPFTLAHLKTKDPGHQWTTAQISLDHGKMDGFIKAGGVGTVPMGYYNGTTIPVYWDLAEQYSLSDSFFSSEMGNSLPNHWYLLAADSPAIVKQKGLTALSLPQKHVYLNQANATPTIEDELLNKSGVSWRYYDFQLASYQTAINTQAALTDGSAYNYWSPLAGREQSYVNNVNQHFAGRGSFFTAARSGNLPNISWVVPSPSFSDHPVANLSSGQNWVAQVANAIESSPEWNSTVLFVAWDDYGGFYDHVVPPKVDNYGWAFRVPLLVIGPHVKRGYISHTNESFESILRLMEWKFGLGCFAARDCNATLPLDYFNFSTPARLPMTIPDFAHASYPLPLQAGRNMAFAPETSFPIGIYDPVNFTLQNED
jgi:phospholipase C